MAILTFVMTPLSIRAELVEHHGVFPETLAAYGGGDLFILAATLLTMLGLTIYLLFWILPPLGTLLRAAWETRPQPGDEFP